MKWVAIDVKATKICFDAASGLEVNFFKIKLIGIGVEDQLLVKYADIMACRVGGLPATYLGMPSCLGSAKKSLWNPAVKRVERKLSSWKANYLSIGGRVALIKSVLLNL